MACHNENNNLEESILEAIKFISDKRHDKPTKDIILSMLCVNGEDIHEGLLEVLLDGLIECNIIEEQGKDYGKPYYVMVKSAGDNSGFQSNAETWNDINLVNIRQSNNESKDFENFIDNQLENHRTKEYDNNIYEQLIRLQKEQLKNERENVLYLKKEIDTKQQIIDKLLDLLSSQKNPSYIPSEHIKERYVPKPQINRVQKEKIAISASKEKNKVLAEVEEESIEFKTPEIKKMHNVTKRKHSHNRKGNMRKENNYNNTIDNNNNNNNNDSVKENVQTRTVYVLGDSMLKHINGWEISQKLDNCKVYVEPYRGATVRCLKDHVKPAKRKNPDHCILHVGTNDLDSETSPDMIAKSIEDVASSLKSNSCDVSVSSNELHERALEVNKYLEDICIERNLFFMDNSKKIKEQHLNNHKLHLNRVGKSVFKGSLLNHIKNLMN